MSGVVDVISERVACYFRKEVFATTFLGELIATLTKKVTGDIAVIRERVLRVGLSVVENPDRVIPDLGTLKDCDATKPKKPS